MANLIGIVGASGTGKSSSLRNLDPNKTFIINVQGKQLPFKGSAVKYNAEAKNIAAIDSWNIVSKYLQGISDSRPEIDTIVIDDALFIMTTEFFKRATEKGWNHALVKLV